MTHAIKRDKVDFSNNAQTEKFELKVFHFT